MARDVEAFIRRLDNLEFDAKGLRIEFCGGEPFAYWKVLKPLAEGLAERLHGINYKFLVITNGSLLTDEICDWLVKMNFCVSVSHDGPGQSARGEDPLENQELRERILRLRKRLGNGRFSFNAMMHKRNLSRERIREFFVRLTGDVDVVLGEGQTIDAYDDGGFEMSLHDHAEHIAFRKNSFNEIVDIAFTGFPAIHEKVNRFISMLLEHNSAYELGQKCGMDRDDHLAVDLMGNVLTCQNVSASSIAPNGQPHKGGTIDRIEEVEIKTATRNCPDCPVVSLCQGSCMFLQGRNFEVSCENSYSNNIPLFAAAFERITGGFIPFYIEGGRLPESRRDIYGIVKKHKERKVIPIRKAA